MSRLVLSLALIPLTVACGEAAPEPSPAVEAVPAEVVEMDEAMISIPASELEMLEEEVNFLREETERMQTELEESKSAPKASLVARQVSARSNLVRVEQELARLKAELAETKTRLATAEARNVELEEDLEETRETLVETSDRLARTETTLKRTRDDLDGALRVAADAGWSDLVSKSQVALCPKGGRKKMDRCRSEVRQNIAYLEPAARACLRAGHASPQLQGQASGESMPRQAVWIGESTQDWYVVMCDPTLPEAQALLAGLDERGRRVQDRDLDDFEPDDLIEEKSAPRTQRSVTRVSREERAPRANRVVDEPDRPRSEAREPEPREPEDLLGDDDGDFDLAALGLEDLDGDADDKKSRAERKREKKEAEELEAARRKNLRLDRAGSDLIDE